MKARAFWSGYLDMAKQTGLSTKEAETLSHYHVKKAGYKTPKALTEVIFAAKKRKHSERSLVKASESALAKKAQEPIMPPYAYPYPYPYLPQVDPRELERKKQHLELLKAKHDAEVGVKDVPILANLAYGSGLGALGGGLAGSLAVPTLSWLFSTPNEPAIWADRGVEALGGGLAGAALGAPLGALAMGMGSAVEARHNYARSRRVADEYQDALKQYYKGI